ncbi:MAG: asparagine synthase [Nitrosopumilus sp. B06]|nr:MAG: asparagine synthase [Nitrosopumilus sp. B06]
MSSLLDAYEKIRAALKESCNTCRSDLIALSGGLDSTIVACLQREKPAAMTVIAKDFVSTDLTYCQLAAKETGLPLSIYSTDTTVMLEAVEETIKILGNFNDIEIRNSTVMYLAISWARENGYDSITTGDGADELFAGYDFMVNMPESKLTGEIERVCSVMHFSSQKIGKALGVRVESPFLEDAVVEMALQIPAELKVKGKDGKRYGKWILRKTFEKDIPIQIVWRPKSPMQDGAGTAGLTGLFESLMDGEKFEEKRLAVRESDGVTIRSRESMYYYETYKKTHGVPAKSPDTPCPYCGYGTDGSRFCRMCGAFPI